MVQKLTQESMVDGVSEHSPTQSSWRFDETLGGEDGSMQEIHLQKINEDRWHGSKWTIKIILTVRSMVADPVY